MTPQSGTSPEVYTHRISTQYAGCMNLQGISTVSRLLVLSTLTLSSLLAGQDRVALVNPLIGTTNGGNVFPGASRPLGIAQFTPEASPVNMRRMIADPGGY